VFLILAISWENRGSRGGNRSIDIRE
jgi:hypothetical protein